MADPHSVLGVGRSASKAEIKKAYLRLCMEWHPDRHAMSSESVQRNAATHFKRVTEAYELLVDDSRRRAHMHAGHRSAGAAQYGRAYADASYSSEFAGSTGRAYSGYRQWQRRRGHFDFGSVWRSFTSFGRAEAVATLGVGALMLVGAMVFEPLASAAWERQNEGKLFAHVEKDVLQSQLAELQRLRAARQAREAQPEAQRSSSSMPPAVEVTAPAAASPVETVAARGPGVAAAGAAAVQGEQLAEAALQGSQGRASSPGSTTGPVAVAVSTASMAH